MRRSPSPRRNGTAPQLDSGVPPHVVDRRRPVRGTSYSSADGVPNRTTTAGTYREPRTPSQPRAPSPAGRYLRDVGERARRQSPGRRLEQQLRQRLAASQPVQPGVGVGAQDRQRSAIRRPPGGSKAPRGNSRPTGTVPPSGNTLAGLPSRHRNALSTRTTRRYAASWRRTSAPLRVASASRDGPSAPRNVIATSWRPSTSARPRARPEWADRTPGGPSTGPGSLAVATGTHRIGARRRTRGCQQHRIPRIGQPIDHHAEPVLATATSR